MKPMTATELRAEVSRLPTEHRECALRLAKMARNRNPFLPSAAASEKIKGKAR